jgi:hypothetical protein
MYLTWWRRSNEAEITTTRGGHRFATSIDGSLTGRGGDIIVIDDPHKLSEVESDIKREHVYDTYRNTILTRLDNNENGAIILVGQRSHNDDLFGAVLLASAVQHSRVPIMRPMAGRLRPVSLIAR